MPITLCIKSDDVRRHVFAAKKEGKKVGVVPTMGALHQGHLSLVKACGSECDFTVVTVFVNPTQFGPNEDFEKYPRDLDKDLELLEGLGVNVVFAPNANEIYAPGHSTFVQPPSVAEPLEGQLRPGHFQGVTTIVLKLFMIVPADVAFFGQKDFQQTRVIQQMVQDLDIPVSVQVCPTTREADGLALSSRNAYLSDAQRQQALSISQALKLAVEMKRKNLLCAEDAKVAMTEHLLQAGIEKIDYVAIVDAETMQPVEQISRSNIALIAAYSGATRLIDNVRFD
jgi:pantoate--beta-alanine ligase